METSASDAEIYVTYETDTTNWISSCAAYLRNAFMICKHLIAGAWEVTKPPFIRFQLVEDRLFPDINGESNFSTALDNTPTIPPPALDLEPSYEGEDVSVNELQNEVLELLEWGRKHCLDLSKDATRVQQLLNFRDNTLHQLKRYSVDVQQ